MKKLIEIFFFHLLNLSHTPCFFNFASDYIIRSKKNMHQIIQFETCLYTSEAQTPEICINQSGGEFLLGVLKL